MNHGSLSLCLGGGWAQEQVLRRAREEALDLEPLIHAGKASVPSRGSWGLGGVSVGLRRQPLCAGALRSPSWAQPLQWWGSPQAQVLPWAPLGEVRPTHLPSVVLGEVQWEAG